VLPVANGGLGTPTQETPGGSINGSNTAFTLANTPQSGPAVILTLDGLTQIQGVDYTISGTSITMTTAPALGQMLWATYTH
jgi:hypothetical protein